MIDSFRIVVETATPDQLENDLIEAYDRILESHKSEILLQMQAQTIQEEVIRQAMQKGMSDVRAMVLEAFTVAGIAEPLKRTMIFLAIGMLCNISTALDMPELKDR